MSHENLYNACISILKDNNITYNNNNIAFACQYYNSNLTRIEVYNELKKIIKNHILIGDILNIYDCLKDTNKQAFPKFTKIISLMRVVKYYFLV